MYRKTVENILRNKDVSKKKIDSLCDKDLSSLLVKMLEIEYKIVNPDWNRFHSIFKWKQSEMYIDDPLYGAFVLNHYNRTFVIKNKRYPLHSNEICNIHLPNNKYEVGLKEDCLFDGTSWSWKPDVEIETSKAKLYMRIKS